MPPESRNAGPKRQASARDAVGAAPPEGAANDALGARATGGLGLLLLAAALAFDGEGLLVPGVTLMALGLGTWLWVFSGARGLVVSRRLAATSVLEGEPVEVAISVRARGLFLPAGRLDDALLDAPVALAVGRREMDVAFAASLPRRGRHALAPSRATVADPLGLARREVQATAGDELLVLPRLPAVQAHGLTGAGDALGLRAGRPQLAAELDFDGVRPMRPGAPAARIVWPAYARTGELIERRMRAESDGRPLVVLDPSGAAGQDDVDEAVRGAAALARHLALAGGCAVLLPGDRRAVDLEPTLTGWGRLHVALALVADDDAPSLAGVGPRRGVVVLVSARRRTAAPRLLAQAPPGGRVLVMPGELPGRRAAITVGGCRGYEMTPTRERTVVTA